MKSLVPWMLAVLAGCASIQQVIPHSHKALDIPTPDFPLRAVVARDKQPTHMLRVYLEGDGRAWVTSSQPSSDPTPPASHMLARAIADQQSVYLARPCQYVSHSECSVKVWTDARFSRKVLNSTHAALDSLKAMHHSERIELIGFSGGAAIALMLAAERDDIKQVQTIAGNIDPQAWTRHHKISPLKGSLSMSDFATELKRVPQRHFVGSQDKVIPPELVAAYIDRFNPDCVQVIRIEASHNAWEKLREEDLNSSLICGESPGSKLSSKKY